MCTAQENDCMHRSAIKSACIIKLQLRMHRNTTVTPHAATYTIWEERLFSCDIKVALFLTSDSYQSNKLRLIRGQLSAAGVIPSMCVCVCGWPLCSCQNPRPLKHTLMYTPLPPPLLVIINSRHRSSRSRAYVPGTDGKKQIVNIWSEGS